MNPQKAAKIIQQLNEKVRVLKRERTDARRLLRVLERRVNNALYNSGPDIDIEYYEAALQSLERYRRDWKWMR